MSSRTLAAIALLAAVLSGCNNAPDTSARKTAAVQTLNGQWLVKVMIPDLRLKGGPVIRVTATESRILVSSQCVWWAWDYHRTGQSVAMTPRMRVGVIENGEAVPVPMCARGLTKGEGQITQLFGEARVVEDTGTDELVLTGAKGSLTLARAAGIEGRWIVRLLGGKVPDTHPLRLDISDRRIDATSQCVSWSWTYQRNGTALSLHRNNQDTPICERSRTPSETQFEAMMAETVTWAQSEDQRLIFKTPSADAMLVPDPD